jgi:hypothetical protein
VSGAKPPVSRLFLLFTHPINIHAHSFFWTDFNDCTCVCDGSVFVCLFLARMGELFVSAVSSKVCICILDTLTRTPAQPTANCAARPQERPRLPGAVARRSGRAHVVVGVCVVVCDFGAGGSERIPRGRRRGRRGAPARGVARRAVPLDRVGRARPAPADAAGAGRPGGASPGQRPAAAQEQQQQPPDSPWDRPRQRGPSRSVDARRGRGRCGAPRAQKGMFGMWWWRAIVFFLVFTF